MLVLLIVDSISQRKSTGDVSCTFNQYLFLFIQRESAFLKTLNQAISLRASRVIWFAREGPDATLFLIKSTSSSSLVSPSLSNWISVLMLNLSLLVVCLCVSLPVLFICLLLFCALLCLICASVFPPPPCVCKPFCPFYDMWLIVPNMFPVCSQCVPSVFPEFPVQPVFSRCLPFSWVSCHVIHCGSKFGSWKDASLSLNQSILDQTQAGPNRPELSRHPPVFQPFSLRGTDVDVV